MANRGFNSVFVLMGVCICTQLDVVLLQSNPVDWPGYYKETTNADFAIDMQYHDGSHQLSVFFFYDTGTAFAKNFFSTKIPNALFEGLYSCQKELDLEFYTCSISHRESGSLVCPKVQGQTQCYDNKYQICVMNALKDKFDLKGKFLSCYFSGNSLDQCAEKFQLNITELQACASSKTTFNAAQQCSEFHNNLDRMRRGKAPAQQNASKYPDAFTDFKGALCQVLKDVALKCTAVCG